MGENVLKEGHSDKVVGVVGPRTDKIDEKVERDIKSFFQYYKNKEQTQWWERFFEDLRQEEENETYEQENIIEFIKKKKVIPEPHCEPIICENEIRDELQIPRTDEVIPPVIIGKKNNKTVVKVYNRNEMVLLDMAKYADEWPQIAKVLDVKNDELQILWYKGSKTSAWKPATRRVSGQRGGRTEPFIENVNKSNIWYTGFSLTMTGYLPKHVKDALDAYIG